ncbi:MAG TPA: transcription termination factor NusA [Phycisphaerales bacterium]|nr:MAG: transcription termination factor NusA [Planctomycetes bacterium GWC2_45_44]HBG77322.1 transcription termination factor NusA [Phycisphaerales bacterium]HBR19669.1 transcription termination factor NusA [Phycisphaerales bacterium]
MNQELVRIVDNIARDKNIDRESIFADLESAMVSATRKYYGKAEIDVQVHIDRTTGDIVAFKEGVQIDIKQLGRIPAQTAKQVMIQKIKADERQSVYDEFVERKGEIISGTVVRYEGGSVIVNLNSRAEAVLPKTEQISGQSHHVGERIRGMILDVRDMTSAVKIILSRTHPEFIRRLFELEVPEVAEGIIEIKALAREAGYRTKLAVISNDNKVDAVGACVGVRGSRIKNIVDELGGEKIDIVRWNESSQELIANALMPAKCSQVALCFELGGATVVVPEDQLSLAIGKHGQNVRLAARLTDWDIDILTPEEYNLEVEKLSTGLKNVEGLSPTFVDKLIALGIISVLDLAEIGAEPLVKEIGISPELAAQVIKTAEELAKKQPADAAVTIAQSLMGKTPAKTEADSQAQQ